MERHRIRLTRWQHVTLAVLWIMMVILHLVFLTVNSFIKIISFNTTLTENLTTIIADSMFQTPPLLMKALATNISYYENVTNSVNTTFTTLEYHTE